MSTSNPNPNDPLLWTPDSSSASGAVSDYGDLAYTNYSDLLQALRQDLHLDATVDIETGTVGQAFSNDGFTRPARKYRASAASIPGGAWTPIALDGLIDDPYDCFTASSGSGYTALYDGRYAVAANCSIAQVGVSSSYIEAFVTANGDTPGAGNLQKQLCGSSTTYVNGQAGSAVSVVSGYLNLAAGDYLLLWIFTATAINLGLGPWANYLSVFRVQ